MLPILYRVILRPLRREPVRTALTLLAVALGVAVVVAIELAGAASVANFQSSMQAVAGQADFEITATGGLSDQTLASLATAPLPFEYVPRIEDQATLDSGESVPLIGLDVIAIASKTSQEGVQAFDPNNASRRIVWLGSRLFQRFPKSINLTINDQTLAYSVAGQVPPQAGAAADSVAVLDLGLALRVTGKTNRLDRIEVHLPDNYPRADARQQLQSLVPPDALLAEAGAQTAENRKMLDGFRWNVRILSYIALVVGAFLIYNTIAVSVVRRRAEIGILRALGATPNQTLALFLGEAAAFGLAGGLTGLAFGRILAEGAVRLMGATVEGLYVSGQAAPIRLTPFEIALALLAGIGISLLAALAPALEAAAVQPTEAMARGRQNYNVRRHESRYAWFALAAAALAAILTQLPPPGRKPWWGYLAALLLILAGSLATPLAVARFASVIDPLARRLFGIEALLAARGIRASVWRSSVLTAAVATAIAMMVSIGVMVGSFRTTVITWLDAQLVADFYLRPNGPVGVDRHPTIDVSVADQLEKLPGVAAVDRFRVYEIRYNNATATLAGGQTQITDNFNRIAFLPGTNRDRVMAALRNSENAVVVSEPFSNKHRVQPGDRIRLPMGGQTPTFEVVGIYYDYASERGYIIMDRQTLLRYLPDPNPSNLAVYIQPNANYNAVREAVTQAVSHRAIGVFPSRELRSEAIRTFDRTFAITYALELVAIAVAVMSVAGSLLALVIDRRRELGLLSFLGAAPSQIRRLVLFEAGFTGIVASVLGALLGALLSLVLIFVINKQSFGWSIQLHWPVTLMSWAILGIYLATVLAALYPARLAANLNPIEVIHEE